MVQDGVLRGISIQLGVMDGCKASQGANIFTDIAFEMGQGLLQLHDRHFYVSSAAGSVCQVQHDSVRSGSTTKVHAELGKILMVHEPIPTCKFSCGGFRSGNGACQERAELFMSVWMVQIFAVAPYYLEKRAAGIHISTTLQQCNYYCGLMLQAEMG